MLNGSILQLSIRNLRRLSGLRVVLWFLPSASSVPLHSFYIDCVHNFTGYNSTVLASITASEYMVFSVTEGFLNASVQEVPRNGTGQVNAANKAKVANHMFNLHQADTLERPSVTNCVNACAQKYINLLEGVSCLLTPTRRKTSPMDPLRPLVHKPPL